MGSWNCASCTFANTSDSGEAVCTKCHAKRVPSCAKCHAEMRYAGLRMDLISMCGGDSLAAVDLDPDRD